jgi:hypothetical protein
MSNDVVFTTVYEYDPDFDMTWTYWEQYTVTPSATITSVVTQTAYVPLPADGIILEADFQSYGLKDGEIAPATFAISDSNGTPFVAYVFLYLMRLSDNEATILTSYRTSATPFVYFSAYEVERAVPTTAVNGRATVTTVTETFNLPAPYGYSYWVKGIEDSAVATGTVPPDFVQQIPQSSCAAGTLQASVTVLVVVDLYYVYYPNAVPLIVHIESTALGFDDPPVIVQDNTKKATPKSTADTQPTHDVPIIEQTADGFSSTPPVIKPNIPQTPAAPTSSKDNHNANGSPGQGPNVPQPTQHTVGTIGTDPVVIGPSSVVVVGSRTVTPGAPPITVGGQPVSLAPSGSAIIVGGSRTSVLPQVAVPVSQPRPPPILTIGSSTLTANAATQFFISPGQTLTPGGTVVIDNTVVSLAPSASFLVVGGSTQILPTAPTAVFTPQPTIVVGGSTFTANAGTSFLIGGQTLAPNQQIIVDNGNGATTLSLAADASSIIINGVTSTIVNPAAATQLPELTIGGAVVTANPSNTFVIDGQTLAPGQIITVSGTTVSLGPSASFVVVNGVTSTLVNPEAAVATPRPEITFGGSIFTANPSGTFVINGQTLAPGQVITVDGTTLSLGPSASFIVINGATSTLANPVAQITPPPLTIGNGIFTALPGTGTTYMIGSLFLTPGGVVTVADTTISLAPGATALIINGQTTFLNPQAPITNPPLLTIGTQTFTALPGAGTTFVISGQTLTPGGTITLPNGLTVSLAPGATELIYGSSGRSTTTALFPATTTRSRIVTTTSSAAAGATGANGIPAETSTKAKGAASNLRCTSLLQSWILSILVGLTGLLLHWGIQMFMLSLTQALEVKDGCGRIFRLTWYL